MLPDSAAIPFLIMIALGILALTLSVFLRSLVDRRMELARRERDSFQEHDHQMSTSSFWLRYGEAVKRSIQSLAWTLVGLGLLNLVSYALSELAENLQTQKDGTLPARLSVEVQKMSLWIKQGADILLKIVILIIAGVWVARFFHSAVRGLLNGDVASRTLNTHPRMKIRTDTLLTTSGYVINITVFIICMLMGLQMLGVSVAPLLATAGVASVAIGFGAQSLVRDFLAGFFILFEDQFAVGDVITIDGRTGTVERLTLRSTKLRLSDGSLLVIPNGEIKKIENATSGFSQIDYKISVLYGVQVDAARHILAEQVQSLVRDFQHDVLAAPEILGIDSVKDSAVILRAKIKTAAGRQYVLERELHSRVLGKFIEAQIVLPACK